MKTLIKYFLSLVIATFFFACGDDDDPSNISAQQAAAKALEIVSGQVTSTELDNSGTVPEWDVDIITDVGSKITMTKSISCFEFRDNLGTFISWRGML